MEVKFTNEKGNPQHSVMRESTMKGIALKGIKISGTLFRKPWEPYKEFFSSVIPGIRLRPVVSRPKIPKGASFVPGFDKFYTGGKAWVPGLEKVYVFDSVKSKKFK